MKNYLGIDFGTKKVGVAIAPGGILAAGIANLLYDKNFFGRIVDIVEKENINVIVVGLPVNLDGSFTRQTELTNKFIQTLCEQKLPVEVVTCDEKLSTREARRNISSKKVSEDKEAARIILQGFLDRMKTN